MTSTREHNTSVSPSSIMEEGLPLHGEATPSRTSDFSSQRKEPIAVGRFAPTPSGKLHLGNLFSFLIAYLEVKKSSGKMLLRIEDLDPARSKQSYIDAVFRNLSSLGFEWENEPVYQSRRSDAYQEALEELEKQDLLYPCFCTRADLHAANAPHFGEETIYAGTCRSLSRKQQHEKAERRNPATRVKVPNKPITFIDLFQGAKTFNLTECSGDFIVRRSDSVFAYQLAVVVDDAYMGVNSVIRGCDLITSTPRQIFLQRCLNLPTPAYGHVPLIVDSQGKRLAKRNKDTDIDFLLNEKNMDAPELLGKLAYCTGLIDEPQSTTLDELIRFADVSPIKGKERISVPFDALG